MNYLTALGLLIIWTSLVFGLGAFLGRNKMLHQLGMTWQDFLDRIEGRQ